MKLSDFDYNLPKELIAQEPVKPRDHSRLLVLDRKTGKIEHKLFYNIVLYLKKGDVLVMNNSKVFPARLIGNKQETSGKIEVFLHRQIKDGTWECLIGGRGARVCLIIEFNKKLKGEIVANHNDGTWEIKFNKYGREFMKIIEKIGFVPLPPYIKRTEKEKSDVKNYQTIYADDKKTGSVAAPTAGFHFTPELIKKIKKMGVQIEYVTLHVGLGTFTPVKTKKIEEHKMHNEWIEIDQNTIERIAKAKAEGRRIIAVGTTSARTLESAGEHICHAEFIFASQDKRKRNEIPDRTRYARLSGMTDFKDWTNIFIHPGYKFKVVDGLITNFHLPKSTLLMLVSALAGREKIKDAYKEATRKKYRFFSYGDAMFIK